MAREYLKDAEFLKALDEMRIKEHYITLQVMNFQEEPIRLIQGIATAGNITVNGSSAVRRTLNLTIVAPENENDLSNIDNIISANKKIKVELGLKNPFSTYKYYGDIIWFPLGVYVITEATSATSATSATISIKGKDKMCMLDGTCGGVLPATVTFHETQVQLADGEYAIEQVPIYTIIKECVSHYGKESEQNIIINDLDIVAKQSVNYIGSIPIWFDDEFKLSPIISETMPDSVDHQARKYVYGQDIGYIETDFTYPGELVFSAGQTVVEVLDKIIQTIGNYEYFYDLDGRFIFQEKQNYLNHYYTPVTELNECYYVKAFSDSKYYKVFENAKDAVSYYNAPKFDNLKNDFVVWGTKTNADGVTKAIKYHLAVDEKPILNLATQYMFDVTAGENGEHLYYLFDASEDSWINGPEEKPIELTIEDEKTEEDIMKILNEIVHKDYVNYASSEQSFTIYFKITWKKQIRYYKAKIKYHNLDYLIYDERLTESIKDESIVIGIYIPPEQKEEEDKDNDEKPGLDITFPNPDIPDVGDDIENPSPGQLTKPITQEDWEWWASGGDATTNQEALQNLAKRSETSVDSLVNELDPWFGMFGEGLKDLINGGKPMLDSNKPSSTPDKEENEESNVNTNTNPATQDIANREFTAIYINFKENKYSLGYVDKKGSWIEVYSLGDNIDILIKDLDSVIKSIGAKYATRVFVFNDFNKENTNNFTSIDSINLLSQYSANPQKLKIDNKNASFSYEFNAIESQGKIKMTKEERQNMITQLLPFYLDKRTELISDINAIYTLGSDGKVSGNENNNSNNENNNLNAGSHTKPTLPQKPEELNSYLNNLIYARGEANNLNFEYELSGYGNGIINIGDEWKNNNNSSSEDNKDEDDLTILIPFLDGINAEFKVVNKTQAELIYKYSQAGMSTDNLINELYDYWKNNVIEKNDIPKQYIIKIITSIPEEPVLDYSENFHYTLIGKPCNEWREELYRQALLNQESAGQSGYYDEELLAFWRDNFDTLNESWRAEWEDFINNDKNSPNPWDGWNPAIYRDPGLLIFWLDFIDGEQIINKYSVNQIGRRTKAISKENLKMLYKLEVPDVLFIENTGDISGLVQEYRAQGQMCCALKTNEMKYFASSATGSTAFDLIREMLYNYLSYNTSVTINCIPKYYLEPNNLIYISDSKSNIQGDFFITQYTLPLTYNGTMTINTVQTTIRV